ncbi:hypothetical protein HMI54_003617, partial [Coelomomyces lativittatus]
MFITFQTASFFLFFISFFLNFVFGQQVKVVYLYGNFTFPKIHKNVRKDFPFDLILETKLESVKKIQTKFTKNQRKQKQEKPKPQASTKITTSSKTSKSLESSFSNVFSFSKFHQVRNNDLFFGSGFVSKENLLSTSFPHYHMYSTIPQRYSQQNVVLSLIHEDEAKKQEKILCWIQDIFGKNSVYWLPVFDIDSLYNDLFYKCSPYYCSVNKYLEGKRSLNLVEAEHLTLFILMICLKLEEMHLGFQGKFSLDYVFLKDEKKGITFDNLVLGGY